MAIPISNLYATWANTSYIFTGIGMNVNATAYDANSSLMDLKLNSSSLMKMSSNGILYIGNIPVFGGANSANVVASLSYDVANSSFNKANSANILAGTAFDKANSANINATNASLLSSGTVATARLGSGTASSTTALYGDSSWKTPVNTVITDIIATGSGHSTILIYPYISVDVRANGMSVIHRHIDYF